jgi:hypothetical protein
MRGPHRRAALRRQGDLKELRQEVKDRVLALISEDHVGDQPPQHREAVLDDRNRGEVLFTDGTHPAWHFRYNKMATQPNS